MIRAYDFHPPDDVRVFDMPDAGVLRLDDEMLVAEVRNDDVVRRHYAFRDRWFTVTCTTDLGGGFVEARSPQIAVPYAFKCDIVTPMLCTDDAIYSVDLWLDVVIRRDGSTHAVCDEDDFAHAQSQGWLSKREASSARAELDDLLDIIRRGAFVDMLVEAQPFVPTKPPEANPTNHVGPNQTPLLQPHRRPSW